MSDTSKEYIAMSDCPEIQDGWKPKIGDWTDCGIITNIINRESIIVYYAGSGHFPEFGLDELKWLPQQDQLQGMRTWDKRLTPREIVETFCVFTGFKQEEYYNSFKTMEQLWLAFVMWELHQKKWTDGEWVKS